MAETERSEFGVEPKKKKKTGRPRIEIDQEEFEKLCGIQCTLDEIAGWFRCSPDTIERWCKRTYKATFADTFKKCSGWGKASLRRYQMNLAKKSATMAIWLGKQWLGQRDLPEDQIETEDSEAYFASAMMADESSDN